MKSRITRFRIEAIGETKEDLTALLIGASTALMKHDNEELEIEFPFGMWECTHEAVTGAPGKYLGRMVFAFREEGP